MKSRICVYISDETAARLMAEAERRGIPKSFIVRAALDQFLGSESAGGEAMMMRRLNWMSRQLEHLDRDLRVVNETVALHARYHLAVTPAMSAPARDDACKLGSARFDEFAAQVGRRVHLGLPLMRETMDRISVKSPLLFARQDDGPPLSARSTEQEASENALGMTPEATAAVREDGSHRGFPRGNGASAASAYPRR